MEVGAENSEVLGTGGGVLEEEKVLLETDLAKNTNFSAVEASRVGEEDKVLGRFKKWTMV